MGSSPTLPIAESLSTKAVLRAASEPQSCETAPWRAPGQRRAGSALGAANADATCARLLARGGHHRARRPGSPCGARGTPRGVGAGVRIRRMNESGRRLELNDGETAGIALRLRTSRPRSRLASPRAPPPSARTRRSRRGRRPLRARKAGRAERADGGCGDPHQIGAGRPRPRRASADSREPRPVRTLT